MLVEKRRRRCEELPYVLVFLLSSCVEAKHGGADTICPRGDQQHGMGSPGEVYTIETNWDRGIRFRLVSRRVACCRPMLTDVIVEQCIIVAFMVA